MDTTDKWAWAYVTEKKFPVLFAFARSGGDWQPAFKELAAALDSSVSWWQAFSAVSPVIHRIYYSGSDGNTPGQRAWVNDVANSIREHEASGVVTPPVPVPVTTPPPTTEPTTGPSDPWTVITRTNFPRLFQFADLVGKPDPVQPSRVVDWNTPPYYQVAWDEIVLATRANALWAKAFNRAVPYFKAALHNPDKAPDSFTPIVRAVVRAIWRHEGTDMHRNAKTPTTTPTPKPKNTSGSVDTSQGWKAVNDALTTITRVLDDTASAKAQSGYDVNSAKLEQVQAAAAATKASAAATQKQDALIPLAIGAVLVWLFLR